MATAQTRLIVDEHTGHCGGRDLLLMTPLLGATVVNTHTQCGGTQRGADSRQTNECACVCVRFFSALCKSSHRWRSTLGPLVRKRQDIACVCKRLGICGVSPSAVAPPQCRPGIVVGGHHGCGMSCWLGCLGRQRW